MKKKIVFLSVIMITLFSFTGIVKAYESCGVSVSTNLGLTCQKVCSDELLPKECECTCQNDNLDLDKSICAGKVDGTDGKHENLVCVATNICNNGFSDSKWCKEHNQGKDPITASSIYGTICRAAAGKGATGGNSEVSSCTDELKDSNCKNETECKKVVCAMEEYRSSKYCTSDSLASTIVSQNTKPVASKGSGSAPGTIEDDANNVKSYTVENCFGFGELVYYASLVLKILHIVAPIFLIIWSSIDLLKSVIAGDEKGIVEKRKPIIQRFIAAMVIYIVPWIVSTLVSSIGGDTSWFTCWKNNRFSFTSSSKKTSTSNRNKNEDEYEELEELEEEELEELEEEDIISGELTTEKSTSPTKSSSTSNSSSKKKTTSSSSSKKTTSSSTTKKTTSKKTTSSSKKTSESAAEAAKAKAGSLGFEIAQETEVNNSVTSGVSKGGQASAVIQVAEAGVITDGISKQISGGVSKTTTKTTTTTTKKGKKKTTTKTTTKSTGIDANASSNVSAFESFFDANQISDSNIQIIGGSSTTIRR